MAKKEEELEMASGNFQFPLSSVIASKTKRTTNSPNNGVSHEQVKSILEDTTNRLNNANGIMELHPDLKLCMQIRTAMLLSPKDMMSPGFHLKVDTDIFDGEVSQDLLTFIEGHFKSKTDIESQMSVFVDEALFKYGAHVWLLLPPNQLDALISPTADLGFESIDTLDEHFKDHKICSHASDRLANLGISGITDNLNTLRRPEIQRRLDRDAAMEVGMESYGSIPLNRKRPVVRVEEVEGEQRANADPIIFDVAVDAVLPITEPSDPSKHLGYLFPIDKHGNIVSNSKEANYFEALALRLQNAMEAKTGDEYAKIKSMGFDIGTKQKTDPEAIMQEYVKAVEEEVRTALKAGPVGEHVEIEEHEALYRLMFSRAMQNQETRLLYVPAWAVDYMAFKYDSAGQGVSLLQETQLYSSLRAVVMFSDLIRQVNNSIPQTDINITLDENDQDPFGTVQTLLQEYGRISQRKVPLGTFHPGNLMEELRKGGFRAKVSGGSKFPNTSLDSEDRQRSIVRADSELTDQLKRAQYAGLIVPPEVIDETLQGNFAINSLISNSMFIKNSMLDQSTFKQLMHNRISKYIYLSNTLWDAIVKDVGEDKADDLVKALGINLPSADLTKLEQQIQSYEQYSEFIDTVMEDHISDALLRGLINSDPAADALEELRALIGSHFKREYLKAQNILPELHALTDADPEDGEILADKIKDYNEVLFKTVGTIITDLMRVDDKLGKDVEKVRDKLENPDEETPPPPEGEEEDMTPADPYAGKPAFNFGTAPDTDTAPQEEQLPEPDAEPEPDTTDDDAAAAKEAEEAEKAEAEKKKKEEAEKATKDQA